MRYHNEKPERWRPQKGNEWYNRGYLPHRDNDQLTQSITFRLADTLPRSSMNWLEHRLHVLENERHQLGDDDETVQSTLLRERFCQIEKLLDAGYGECLLRNDRCADIVFNALTHFDHKRYHLICWCIMPNHVHVVIRLREGEELKHILHSLKSYTAKKINTALSRCGTLWAREYHDRYIRDQKHMTDVIRYVENNPVKAGLAQSPEEWRWSSAYRGDSFN